LELKLYTTNPAGSGVSQNEKKVEQKEPLSANFLLEKNFVLAKVFLFKF
jgi:hypothetical protein